MGYATIEEWAKDSGYTTVDGFEWKNEDGDYVTILECFHGALESFEQETR